MPKGKLIKSLQLVLLFRDAPAGGGSSTITAIAAKGATGFTLTSATNFAINDIVRLGEGETQELVKINGLAGAVVTTAEPLAYDHPALEPVVEQIGYDLGDITEGGVEVSATGDTTDVPVATRRLVLTTLNGYTGAQASFGLPAVHLFNFLVALGLPLTSLAGAGTIVSPYSFATDGNDIGTWGNVNLVVISVLNDGSIWREELWGVDVDYTGIDIALARGELAAVPVVMVASAGGVVSTNANPYTVLNAVNRPGKGKVFDGLTDVGIFTDGAASTLAAAASAGATSISTVATQGVAGGWVRVGSGSEVEYHQVDSVSGPGPFTVALRTKLLRAQAIGVATATQVETTLGNIHEDGVGLTVGGGVDPVRSATRRAQMGLRMGAASFGVTFGVIDFSLVNLARALGIPAADIVAGRLPVGDRIGLAGIDGVYVRGLTQDGSIFRVNLWGTALNVSDVVRAYNNSGPPSRIPMSLRPTSGIQFLQAA
jgi:hypothetical protein